MKSFSLKALALAFVVVAGSANAGITNTVKKYVKEADETLFGKYFKLGDDERLIGGFPPFSTFNMYSRNPLAHAAVVAATVAGISAVAYKTYKHFTKPAVDATEESENVEAQQANTEVVA